MSKGVRRLGAVLLLAFFVLFLQLNNLEVVQASKLAGAPGNSRRAVRDFSRPRGSILTADGAVIAQSVPSNDAFKMQRQYPLGELFGAITGYFSFTYGSDGVERSYDSDLTGRTLPLFHLKDVLSNRIVTENVTLTLSSRLQTVARTALGKRKGAVVALDPTSGAVLAAWSYPSYDPSPLSGHDQHAVQTAWNADIKAPDNPMLPRFYRERYSPGSTFKVVDSAAVFDKNPGLATKPYPVQTSIPLPQTNKTLSNFGGESCGGTLPQLLKVSCNTGFAQVGLDLGADALAGEAMGFGFGAAPPLDLPGGASSVFPSAASLRHNAPVLAYSAIGQEDVAASPLEMALVAAAIANGGVIMKPHVLQEIRDSQGNVVRQAEATEWMRATSGPTAAAVRDMMIGVVNGGTATRAAVPGVQVAAKTGTAQTTGNNAHAWLIAFAPAAQPTIAVAVLVESQPGLGDVVTGGTVAAPIAEAVMAAALGKH